MSAKFTVRHTVADYAAWRSVYDSVEAIRAEHGCTDKLVMRDPADANDLFITHDFPTIDQAVAFSNDPRFADAMKNAGVTSAPRIEIYEVV
jgi:quinol monooxygenase YgiN